ncbi:MAG: DUF5615 family PIN-like protein [Leptolyngbyaceae cyanobacterium bins.59]|nr:DUF5615 family PIN-like protein [Leptolyngbyaceae cyanobacterium bins.59]
MTIALYMDVHVPQAITDQLRRRGIDVLTAFDDETQELPDDQLLERVTQLNRVLFTQDIRFRVLAETWQTEGRAFSGLIFGHQLGGTIGQFVKDLELIAKVSEPNEWLNTVEYIPFK